jgi:hypothetical protein
MGSAYRRMLAAAALIFTMSAIVGLVVLSPLVWRDGSSAEPAPEAVPASRDVAEVVAPGMAEASPRAGQVPPLQDRDPVQPAGDPATQPVRAGYIRPLRRPAAKKPQPVEAPNKAKKHEKKGLGSKKADKHGHHAQGAPGKGHGKGHGKGKSKGHDRDRAPARARG